MIYRVKCKRGHCGARFETDDRDPIEDPGHSAMNLEKAAEHAGWHRDLQGWLCPFDAPKEAAKPQEALLTLCCTKMCNNGNVSNVRELLIADGWHQKKERDVPEFSWLCPACWKTTQPEPIHEQAAAIMNPFPPEFSIDEVRGIAGEVFFVLMRDVLTKAKANADKLFPRLQTTIQHLESALTQCEVEDSNANSRRPCGNDSSSPGSGDAPGDGQSGASSGPPDGGPVPRPEAKADEEIPF